MIVSMFPFPSGSFSLEDNSLVLVLLLLDVPVDCSLDVI